jgi:hypothetical protein
VPQQNRPAPLRVNARSPHGALAIPCDNCHTLTSWKPIRAIPEFDHTRTPFPLRGMHAGVACAQCHASPVFSNVGATCATCHADIHRGQFGGRCEQCHTEKGWSVSIQSIQNHQNRFPLVGAHAVAECDACHRGGATSQFSGLSTDCLSCHITDFQSAKEPNHQALNLSTSCQSCHSMNGWAGATFDHLKFTGFALTGAHSSLDCATCHVGGKFQGTPANCYGCHAKDFNTTSNPNHVQAGFPTDCQTCHTTTTWTGATFDHNAFTAFPLTGAHATVACSTCHVNGQFAGTPSTCVGCHLSDFNGATNPNHVAAGFSTTCQTCHTTTTWGGASFNHNTMTSFPLTGAHTSVTCTSCHVNGQFAGTPNTCVGCHGPDYNRTTNPNHIQAGFPTTCQTCHTTTAWSGAAFNHNTMTAFPLTGAHVNVTCTTCHVNGQFAGTPSTCVGCHLPDFNGTTNPNHVQASFPTTCQTCHNTSTWQGAVFDHAATAFPLTGAHVAVACATCHVNGQFAGTPTTCVSCHLANFNGTTNPNHVAAGFPTTCQNCHTTTTWTGATFNHNTMTSFPLTGAHVSVACATCHVNGQFAGTPQTCVGCHLPDFNGTTNPSHVAAGFATTCQTCHTTTTWTGATFNHSTMTSFPLTGAHVNVACATCHVNGRFAGTPQTCVGCHLPDFNGTTNPNHTAAGFSTTCQTCHTTTTWAGATFNHNTMTSFPLTGAHVSVACATCHVNGQFAGTPQTCVGCHQPDFNGTTNPNHVAAGFPTTCQTCHTTTTWTGATFNHSTMTTFPLTGAHVSVACAACHVNGRFAGTPATCVGCHQPDFNGTTNPNHVSAGFPTDCTTCHSTTTWAGATFNHNATAFPLTGAHVNVACNTCHVNGQFANLSTTCVSCHLTDFNGANNPNHVTAGFPQQCNICHSTSVWQPATFNHSTTAFPLTGAHTTVACASCHLNGNYTTTPTDCYSCHKTEYQNTTDPNHVAAAFATTCQTCHTTSAWTGAKFTAHDTMSPGFPIYSGTHAGKWTTCGDCHVNQTNYATFSCITCHTHTQSSTDPHHNGVRNYVYNGTSCYSCHPQGRN